jgi:hypothetical protein
VVTVKDGLDCNACFHGWQRDKGVEGDFSQTFAHIPDFKNPHL